MTRSMHVALADSRLDYLWAVYPGQDRYEIDEKTTALPLSAVVPLAASLVRA